MYGRKGPPIHLRHEYRLEARPSHPSDREVGLKLVDVLGPVWRLLPELDVVLTCRWRNGKRVGQRLQCRDQLRLELLQCSAVS